MSDTAPSAIYYVMAAIFVASALVSMRLPLGKAVKLLAAWVAIFGIAFVLFAFRGEFSGALDRLRAEATGVPIVSDDEVRVPIANDGHFWVDATVNGRPVRFAPHMPGASPTMASQASRSPMAGTGAFHQSGCSARSAMRSATRRGQSGQSRGASTSGTGLSAGIASV